RARARRGLPEDTQVTTVNARIWTGNARVHLFGCRAFRDGRPLQQSRVRLTARLGELFAVSARLEKVMRENLARLGYAP
ncbi:MAG: hypothetical protein N3C12_14570, partial [Candidatus Binatia bacterium]|nr:hypothetical protein [Candidatus Binatia bacterium]